MPGTEEIVDLASSPQGNKDLRSTKKRILPKE